MILADKLILVAEGAPPKLLNEVKRRVSDPFYKSLFPFEFIALEGILHSVHETLALEVNVISPQITVMLHKLESETEPSENLLRTNLAYFKRLASLQAEVTVIMDSLDAILKVDEDMAGMVSYW